MKRPGAALRHQLLPWLLPLLLLLSWQAGASLGWISSRILPAPLDVGRAFIRLTASGELARHLEISCGRALAGFLVGAAVGLLLGFLTGTSRTLEQLLDSSVQMVRNVPHLALTPLVILWFGIGYMAMNAREFFQTDVVVLAILLYAVLGKLADLAAKGLERRWLRWQPGLQRAAA